MAPSGPLFLAFIPCVISSPRVQSEPVIFFRLGNVKNNKMSLLWLHYKDRNVHLLLADSLPYCLHCSKHPFWGCPPGKELRIASGLQPTRNWKQYPASNQSWKLKFLVLKMQGSGFCQQPHELGSSSFPRQSFRSDHNLRMNVTSWEISSRRSS